MRIRAFVAITLCIAFRLQPSFAEGRLGAVLAPAEIPAGEEFCVRVTASALEHGIERAIVIQFSDQLKFLGAYAADEEGFDTVSLEQYPSVATMFTHEKGHTVVSFEDHTTLYSTQYNAVAYIFRFRAPSKAALTGIRACLVERADLSSPMPRESTKSKQKKRRRPTASTTWKAVDPELDDDFSFANSDTKRFAHAIRVVAGWDKTSRALIVSGSKSAHARLVTDSAVLHSLFEKEFTLSCWIRATHPLQTFFQWSRGGDDSVRWLGTDALGDLIFSAHTGRSAEDTVLSSTSSVGDGAWHHIALTKDVFGKVWMVIDGTDHDTMQSSVGLSNLTSFSIGRVGAESQFALDELSLRSGIATRVGSLTVAERDTVADLFGLFHFEDAGQTARSSVAIRKITKVNDTTEVVKRVPVYFALDSEARTAESSSPVLTDHAVLSVEQSTATKVTFTWTSTSELGVKKYQLQRRIASFGEYEKTLEVKAKQPISVNEEDRGIVGRATYSAVETLPMIGRDIELSYRLALMGKDDSVIAYTQPVKLEFGGERDVFVEQNKPNPFNPKTTINFRLARAANVSIMVYDIMGRMVGVLLDEKMSAGKHSIEVDATQWPGGIYFYKVKTPRTIVTKRMVVAK